MVRAVKFRCAHCGAKTEKPTGAVNRARSKGAPLYCHRDCAGLARRKWKTKAQKVAEKRAYDAEYNAINRDRRCAEKRDYHKRTYDPVVAALRRKERMPLHVEYCRQPAYKAWKQQYDAKYRAHKVFGDYADVFLLLGDVEREIASRMSRYEIMLANGTLNKAMKRRREHASFVSGRP